MSDVEDLKPLTSLRFFAAMFIVLLHAKLYVTWSWLGMTPPTLVHGVSFFFVLSGFILTHVYTSRPTSFRRFIQLRVARLWPVHLCSLLLVLLFIRPMTFDGTGVNDPRLILVANALLLHAISPFTTYQFSFNSVSWSVSTEMFFYAMFPLLLINIERNWPKKLLAAATFTLALFYSLHRLGLSAGSDDPFAVTVSSLTYANPIARGFEFVLGMSACMVWKRSIRTLDGSRWLWTAAEVLVLAFTVLWLTRLYVVGYAKLPLPWMLDWYSTSGSCFVFALLIAVLASGRGVIGKALSLGVMVWLGEASFCIYMTHQILFKVIAWRFPEWATPLFYFTALIAVAAAMHHGVERPARALMRSIRLPGRQPAQITDRSRANVTTAS